MEWRDRVQEYVRERGEGSLRNLEQARRVCQDRERWKKKKLSQNVFFFLLGQLFFLVKKVTIITFAHKSNEDTDIYINK